MGRAWYLLPLLASFVTCENTRAICYAGRSKCSDNAHYPLTETDEAYVTQRKAVANKDNCRECLFLMHISSVITPAHHDAK